MIMKSAYPVRAVITLLLVMSLGSAYAGSFVLTGETTIKGIWFQSGTTLKTFDQGKSPTPEQGTLSRRYQSDGYIWEKGTEIVFDIHLNVLKGYVALGSYGGVALLQSQPIVFYPTGVPTYFKNEQELKVQPYGIVVAAAVPEKILGVNTYPNGSIQSVTSSNAFVYEVNATGGAKKYNIAAGTIQFWPGEKVLTAGKVKQATLAGDHADFLDVIPSGTTVGFDAAGEVNKLQCISTCSYRRFVLKDSGEVEVLPSGYFTLIGKQQIVVGSKTYPAGQKLLLTFDGVVIAASSPQ